MDNNEIVARSGSHGNGTERREPPSVETQWPPPPLDLSNIGTDPAQYGDEPCVWPGFEDGVAVVAGEGGVGKSQICLQTVAAITSESVELPVLGFLPAPTIHGRVVFITFEDKPKHIERRLHHLRRHYIRLLGQHREAQVWRDLQHNLTVHSLIGFAGTKVVCLNSHKALWPENVRRLRRLLAGARVVVIDKLGDLAGDHESDNGAMRLLLGVCLAGIAEEEGCLIIAIHDHVKNATVEAESSALLGAGSTRGKTRGGVVNLWPLPLADAKQFGIKDAHRYVLVRPEKVNNGQRAQQCWLERTEHGVLVPTTAIPEDFIPGLESRQGRRAGATRKPAPPKTSEPRKPRDYGHVC